MPRMAVGLVKSAAETLSAETLNEDSILAEAAAIMGNPDAVLAQAECLSEAMA
jgi:hypothetical protein